MEQKTGQVCSGSAWNVLTEAVFKLNSVCGDKRLPHAARCLSVSCRTCSLAQFVFVAGDMSTFLSPQAGAVQGAAVRRVATFNVSSRREKSLSASISYTTAPPRMFTSKLYDVTPYSLVEMYRRFGGTYCLHV
jgi:hypothetical protein